MKISIVSLIVLLSVLAGCTTTEVVSDSGAVVDVEEDKRKRVEARVNAAKQYIAAENYDRARMHLSRALEDAPKSPDVYEALALVFQSSDEIELAEEHYEKAMQYGDKNSRIQNNYAWFLFEQGKVEQAYEIQQEVVEDIFYENRSLALYNKGLMELKLGKKNEAERSFFRAKSANINFVPAYIELAELYFDKQDYQQANDMIREYRSRTEHTARSTWLAIRLARIFGDKQKEKSLALMMQNKFSKTNQYLAYKESLKK